MQAHHLFAQLPGDDGGDFGATAAAAGTSAAGASHRLEVASALFHSAAYLTIGDAKAMTDDHVLASIKTVDQSC